MAYFTDKFTTIKGKYTNVILNFGFTILENTLQKHFEEENYILNPIITIPCTYQENRVVVKFGYILSLGSFGYYYLETTLHL